MHHLGHSHSTAIEGDRHETRTDVFSRRSGLGLRRGATTRQRACPEHLQAVSAARQSTQARDPPSGAPQDRAARRYDDLRDGTARRVSQALLPDATLRGVGFGRGRDLARRTASRIGDRRLAQSTGAGCSSTPHPTGQAPNSAWLNGTTFSRRSFERSGQPDRSSAGARVGLGRRFDSGRFGFATQSLSFTLTVDTKSGRESRSSAWMSPTRAPVASLCSVHQPVRTARRGSPMSFPKTVGSLFVRVLGHCAATDYRLLP